jgi:hypothetical protein
MTYAKTRLWAVAGGLLIVAAAACSNSDSQSGLFGDRDKPGANYGDGGNSPEKNGGDSAGSAAPGSPTATGVVLVHAAAFPAFRLCFENSPASLPQPDSKVMPEANVVGVEVGSVVRIDPLIAPGKIYVINEKAVRGAPGNEGVSCGELVGSGSRSLTADNDYHVAGTIDRALGADHVQVLAITGCGSQAFLNKLGAASANCSIGTTQPWNTTTGNLEARVLDLATTPEGATDVSLPVQLLHVAPLLDAQLGTASLEVSFGDLSATGKLPQQVASKTPLLTTSDQVMLQVDQAREDFYGTNGFRIELREPGGATKFSVDESLAAVQDLSSPRDVPTSYYRVASNYALLLLGDPSVPTTLDGGAPNPDRRRVHLLAVPVLDPSRADAGADAATDGGDVGER